MTDTKQFNKDFEAVLKFFYNMSFEEFNDVLGGRGEYDSYITEKWDCMKSSFVFFFCNLDAETQLKFIESAKQKYKL